MPAIDRVMVVLGAGAEAVSAGADLTGTEQVVAADWEEGIAASLRAGVSALSDAKAVVITLADQPLITPEVVEAVLARLDGPAPAVRATRRRPGHPVAIKRALRRMPASAATRERATS